jgi:hypothetical protein
MVRSSSRAKPTTPPWHEGFLRLLPAIRQHARISFRHLDPEARGEAVQNCVANAMLAYLRLYELGKADLAYASPLARYAVAQTRAGRLVGNRLNARDVSAAYGQKLKGFCVARLDHYDRDEECWEELVVEDRRAGPAEVAITRIDFRSWLRSLPRRLRKVATTLATGESTSAAAKQFAVSQGRISQIRKELYRSWFRFQGDEGAPVAA